MVLPISPPMQNAPNVFTDKAKRVAALAAVALPPSFRIIMPSTVASELHETTTPWLSVVILVTLTGKSIP